MKTKLNILPVSVSLLAFVGLSAGSALAEEAPFLAPSGEYTSEDTHRYITFSYWHQGLSRPHVRWRDWDATLSWDADNPANSSVSVVIDATSVDTGVDIFDEHIQGDNFFDTENHPEITFVSTGAEQIEEGEGEITGDLTIKGVTKPVTLSVVYNTSVDDTRNSLHKIGFSATASVKRSDFDMGAYVPMVGDDIDIVIEAEFMKPADE